MQNRKRVVFSLAGVVLLLVLGYIYFSQHMKNHEKPERMTGKDKAELPSASPGNQPNLPEGQSVQDSMPVSRELLLGQVDAASYADFSLVDLQYASREGMYMQKEAYAAFMAMFDAALQDGLRLQIVSAFRSFDRQKRIWESKWNGQQILQGHLLATEIDDPRERALEILRFSAMPGTSRHHWGTDIDLNSLDNRYFDQGEGKLIFEWLRNNASRFGFCQPYSAKGEARTEGYEEERWHWSYMPLSSVYLSRYQQIIGYADIQGFSGWETAEIIDVIRLYVESINPDCK